MYFSYLFLFFLLSLPCFPARLIPATTTIGGDNNYAWSSFQRLLDAHKGSKIDGISQLKQYFQRFGYLSLNVTNITDIFDAHFESILVQYQSKLGLPRSGKLDSTTVSQIMLPRCGVSDTQNMLHVRKNYEFFPGQPRWTKLKPMTLTYALSPIDYINYIDRTEITSLISRAFTRWATVIPVNFTEADDYRSADIKIGFYQGDHGDGEPFDGILGVLGHAFSPQNGRFHLDAAEKWAVDFKSEKSKEAIDLESVVTHEIGHVLGLAHTSIKEAVMYPSLSPRTKKVNLKWDDVKGVQALYGSNPNFNYNSLLVSDTSGQAIGLKPKITKWANALLFLLLCFNIIR